MQNSSVLIVHPSDYRFPMATGNPAGKFGGRHYSLDSPGSLTSPPAYDMPLMPGAGPEQKPGVSALSMQNSCAGGQMSMSSCSPPFSQINPLVYSHPGHAGLLPLSKSLSYKLQTNSSQFISLHRFHISSNSPCSQ